MKVAVHRLDDGLPLPSTQHDGDAGLDLHAATDVVLRPGERALVRTGIAIAVPEGYAGLVAPRSGLAARAGLSVVNGPGVVDAGYRGEVKVVLINHDRERDVKIARGDRIAQLLIVPVERVEWVESGELPPSGRGEGGFGSTG